MATPEPQSGLPATTPTGSTPTSSAPTGSTPAPSTPATTPPPATRPAGTAPVTGQPGTGKQVAPTRTGMVWVSVCIAVLLAILLIIFLAQNTRTVAVHFLGLSGSTSLALMLLIAAVAGALITVIAGSARIIQPRRRAHHR